METNLAPFDVINACSVLDVVCECRRRRCSCCCRRRGHEGAAQLHSLDPSLTTRRSREVIPSDPSPSARFSSRRSFLTGCHATVASRMPAWTTQQQSAAFTKPLPLSNDRSSSRFRSEAFNVQRQLDPLHLFPESSATSESRKSYGKTLTEKAFYTLHYGSASRGSAAPQETAVHAARRSDSGGALQGRKMNSSLRPGSNMPWSQKQLRRNLIPRKSSFRWVVLAGIDSSFVKSVSVDETRTTSLKRSRCSFGILHEAAPQGAAAPIHSGTNSGPFSRWMKRPGIFVNAGLVSLDSLACVLEFHNPIRHSCHRFRLIRGRRYFRAAPGGTFARRDLSRRPGFILRSRQQPSVATSAARGGRAPSCLQR